MANDIKIAQWNARSIHNKKLEFTRFLFHYDISVAIILETWLSANTQINYPSYNCIRNDRNDGKGGIAFLIKHNITYNITKISINNLINEPQYIIITISAVTIVGIYIPPTYNANKQFWNKLIRSITTPFIICGDFNLHHVQWGSPYTTRDGEILYNFIQDNDIVCLNNGQPTRLNTPSQQPTAPDLTFCSLTIRPYLIWNIFPDNMHSDHFPLVITWENANINSIRLQHRKNIRNINWELYTSYITDYITNIPQGENIDQYYQYIINIIHKYLNKFHPYINSHIPHRKLRPVWWDESCSKAIAIKRLALRTYKKHMTLYNYIQVKKTAAQTKKLLKQKKQHSWRTYCNNLNRTTNISTIWKNISWYTKRNKERFPIQTIEITIG